MNSIPVLGIPHCNRSDLTERCIQSIDYPVETLVIVRNGPPEQFPMEFIRHLKQQIQEIQSAGGKGVFADKGPAKLIKRLEIIQHPNAGVAASWNEIIKLFPAAWWMIANNDIQFTPGDLKKMGDCVTAATAAGKIYGNHGASWFVITHHGVSTAGLFDENIYPAYLEDCDWSYRADLLGVSRITIPDVRAIHGEPDMPGSCTVNSDEKLREKNSRTHQRNFEYYERKWGGRNEKEIYKTPFNDPHWPVWAWRFEPDWRALINTIIES